MLAVGSFTHTAKAVTLYNTLETFTMRHVEDLSYDDMAIATGAGISALKMRVKRACDALRIRLTEDDGARRD